MRVFCTEFECAACGLLARDACVFCARVLRAHLYDLRIYKGF